MNIDMINWESCLGIDYYRQWRKDEPISFISYITWHFINYQKDLITDHIKLIRKLNEDL